MICRTCIISACDGDMDTQILGKIFFKRNILLYDRTLELFVSKFMRTDKTKLNRKPI